MSRAHVSAEILHFSRANAAMTAAIRDQRWDESVFGPVSTWPQSLRSALSICLGSSFPIAIYWGQELGLIYNDDWSPILGSKHPWALGRPAREVWPEIWDTVGPLFESVLATGLATRSKDQLLAMHRHGFTEECYFDYTFSPISGESGKVEGIFNAVVETTFRVIGERRTNLLRNLSERLADAPSVEQVCDAMRQVLAQDRYDVPFALVYLSREDDPRTLRRAAACGLRCAPSIAPDELTGDTNPSLWPIATVLAGAPSLRFEDLAGRLHRYIDNPVWPEPCTSALIMSLPGLDPDHPNGTFISGISPRLALDTEYQAFLEGIAAAINAAIIRARAAELQRQRTEELAKFDRAKTAFFSNASHEFRTPLTLLLGPLHDALTRSTDASVSLSREELSLMHRNGLRLLKLVNTLLDFSRIEAGRVEAAFEPVDLAQLTADLASNFRSAMERAGLRFSIDCPPTRQQFYVDRDMWEKIVLNLVSNAFKYTLQGAVTVRLSEDMKQHCGVLQVIDTGVGIPEASMPHLFERFYRIENQQGRTREGTGIGLALVQELARIHGGAVRAESVLGRGTSVCVRLPAGTRHLPSYERREGTRPATSVQADAYVEEALRWLPGAQGAEPDTAAAGPVDAMSEHIRLLIADDNADMRSETLTAIRRSEQMFRAIADQAPVVIWEADAAGLVTYMNRYWYEFTGQEPGRAEGRDWLQCVHPEDRQRIEAEDIGATRLKRAFRFEYQLQRVDGVYRWMLDSGVPKTGVDGEFAGFIGTVIDITEHREAERILRDNNASLEQQVAERTSEFNTLWKLTPDILAIANPEGRFVDVNPAATTILGWSKSELLAEPFTVLLHPEDTGATMAEYRAQQRHGHFTHHFENRFRGKDGAYRWILWTAVTAEDRIYATGRDITESKAQADALRQAEEALRQASKMDAVGQLTGGIAHDFNNLLTVVIGNLDTLQRRIEPTGTPRLVRPAENAMAGAKRAAALTQRLLAFARRQPLDPKPTDVSRLVLSMSDMLARTLGERIEIRTVFGAGLWPVEVDPNQLENALLNLALNARDAMPDGGRLVIESANAHLDELSEAKANEVAPGHYVLLTISDTGHGMPPAVLARVFEPFFTTKPVGQGSGLGLPQVYGFVKQSGGHVKVYSEPAAGTTVKIYLPRLVNGSAAHETPPNATERVPDGSSDETILVVEDEAAVRDYSCEILRELGYGVLQAREGVQALRVLERHPEIDVLFTDVGLPGMTGRELADQALALRPRLKVLFTSGYARNAIVHHGRLDPGVELLAKPFTYADLASRIRDMLDGA